MVSTVFFTAVTHHGESALNHKESQKTDRITRSTVRIEHMHVHRKNYHKINKQPPNGSHTSNDCHECRYKKCLEFRSTTTSQSHHEFFFKKILAGCKLFHPPLLNLDRSITNFGSILAFIANFFTKCFTHHAVLNQFFISSRRSQPILHSPRFSGYFSKFSNFSLPSRLSY